MASLWVVKDALIRQMVERIINENEAEFWHLKTAKIALVWVVPDMKKSGRIALATAQKTNPLLELFSQYDFVIKLSRDHWESNLSEAEQESVMVHELRHCGVKYNRGGCPIYADGAAVPCDEDGKYCPGEFKLAYCIVPHDCEIFLADFGTDLPGIERVQHRAQQVFEFAKG